MIRSLAFALLLAGTVGAAAQEGRLRPPDLLACDRNHLTSFTGKVTHYRRGPSHLTVRMKTDENTDEVFRLRGSKAVLQKTFLLDAGPFAAEDWKRIERSASRLVPGMRATVWVCEQPRKTVIDWKPSRD